MWVEVHRSLREKAKLFDLAAKLDMPEPHVIGHLVSMWLWALDNGPAGRIASPAIAARAAGWTGDRQVFWEALQEFDWLDPQADGSCAIHDWGDYTARFFSEVQRREAAKRHKTRLRADAILIALVRARDGARCRLCGRQVDFQDRRTEASGTYDWRDYGVAGDPDNMFVVCRGCLLLRNERPLATAGLTLQPPPTARPGTRELAQRLLAILERAPGWGDPRAEDATWVASLIANLDPAIDPVAEAEQWVATQQSHGPLRQRRTTVENWYRRATPPGTRPTTGGDHAAAGRRTTTGPARESGKLPPPRTPIEQYEPKVD